VSRLVTTNLTTAKREREKMENEISTTSREDWLNKALLLIRNELIDARTTLTTSRQIRVSLAPMASKTLGMCYPSSRSTDGANEITITMHNHDSERILATLVHEAIHAYDDCASKHRGAFRTAALAVGLEGKMTATNAGPELASTLAEYVTLLGPIPHSALSHQAKDKGRNNNKIKCDDCGFQANLSAKWADQIENGFECPVCFSPNTTVIT